VRKHDVEFNVSCAKTGLTFLFYFFLVSKHVKFNILELLSEHCILCIFTMAISVIFVTLLN
jgi:hypothetical protein